MIFYFYIFCVFFSPTRGHVTLTLLRFPGNSDKLDLRIDGSIELSPELNYRDVRKNMSKKEPSVDEDHRALNEYNTHEVKNDKLQQDNLHTSNIHRHKHKELRMDDDIKHEWFDTQEIKHVNNDGLQKQDSKLHKQDDLHTSNIHQHKLDELHNHDDLKGDWFDTHEINYTENDGLEKHKGNEINKKNEFKHTNNKQRPLNVKLHKKNYLKDKLRKENNFKYSTENWTQHDELLKKDHKRIGNDWSQQFKDDRIHKEQHFKDKVIIGRNSDKIEVHWDPDKSSNGNDVQREIEDSWDGGVRHKRHKDGIVGVTQIESVETTHHKVKDDGRTQEFSVHLFKQTIQVLESIKRKMNNNEMRAKVDEMARSYKDQFTDFVRQQRENSVRTKMGDERAILHTMDTSNSILQRLVNFLKADMEKANIGRSADITLQKEVDALKEIEHKHVCTKYGYCRSEKGFTNMLQNCIKIFLGVDDEKMYKARDAITEVLKSGEFGNLIDSKTDKIFKQKVSRLERTEPRDLKEALRVLLGMLQNLQTPLEDEGGNSEVLKKTAAFYNLLTMWEDAMPGDDSNKLEWTDIEKSLGDWRDGKRTDIQDIVKALERNVKRGLERMDPDIEVEMKEQIKIIRG